MEAAKPIVSLSSCTSRPLPPPPPAHDRSTTLATLDTAAAASTQGLPESPAGDEQLYDPVGDGGDEPDGLYDPADDSGYEDAHHQYMDPVAEGEEDDGVQGSASKRIIALYKEAERRKVGRDHHPLGSWSALRGGATYARRGLPGSSVTRRPPARRSELARLRARCDVTSARTRRYKLDPRPPPFHRTPPFPPVSPCPRPGTRL